MQPPIPVDEFNINTKDPAVIVEGDVMLKEYNFIVEEGNEKLLKIGRVGNIQPKRVIVQQHMIKIESAQLLS